MKIAQASLTSVRVAVLLFALACLLYVVKERYVTFVKNGIVRRRYISVFDEPWFEVAICFGPKIPGDVVDLYMNQTWAMFPERYATYDVWNDSTSTTETYFDAAMAVDSLEAYRQFFAEGHFNWTDDVFGVSSLTPALLSQYLDGIRHRLSLGGEDISQDALEHTDIPFLLDYAVCRNYSYKMKFPVGYTGILEHQIYVNDSINDALFDIAWYIDLYVYPRGSFTEFPLIADHVPYRVDLRTHQLLDVIGSKTEKMPGQRPLTDDSASAHINCLTWCLARGLLDHLTCIMPIQIPYIFNTSGQLPSTDPGPSSDERDIGWRQLYPRSVVWPWMAPYVDRPLCRSAEQFRRMFARFSQVYFPRGVSRYPLSPRCADQCPTPTEEYTVVVTRAGTELVPAKRSAAPGDRGELDEEHESVHSVTFYHATTLTVARENWIYSAWEFFIDVSGMTSFVMGLSLIAIHDWGFALIQWAFQGVGLEEVESIGDDEDEEG